MSLWGELKRREVFKVAATYLVASWVIVQVVGVLTDPLNLPDNLDTVVVVLLAIGFPFALVIAWVYEVTPEGVRVTAGDGGIRAGAPSQRLTFVLIGLFVIAVSLMVLERFSAEPSANSFGAGSRVAILPCTNLSPDPSNAFFAPGIHDELIRQLGSLSGLAVISPSSVQQYAGRPTSAPQVAEELRVEAVMECSALYSGDQARLTILLVDGASATSLWSSVYPVDMSDLSEIFEIQADIAMNVANALFVEFFDQERQQIERVPTQSREAYELYLAAKAAGLPGTQDGIVRAVELLTEALAIDETYAQAWTLLSNYQTIMSPVTPALLDEAIAAAERAINLAPESGDGHAHLGFALGARLEWLAAEVAYQRALELGWPLGNMPQYSTQQLAVGHIEQAIETLESNLETNPMNPIALAFLMTAYDTLGDVTKSNELYERGRTLHGDWPFGMSESFALRLGRGDIEFLQQEFESFDQGINAELLAVAADPDSARETLLRFAPGSEGRIEIARWAAFLGDVDLAMDALQEVVTGAGLLMRIAWEPVFSEVRLLPEFQSLLNELDLIEYWNETEWPEFCQQLVDGGVECR